MLIRNLGLKIIFHPNSEFGNHFTPILRHYSMICNYSTITLQVHDEKRRCCNYSTRSRW